MKKLCKVEANKIIYLGTTYKCSACKCQEVILKDLLQEYPEIELKVLDYLSLPEWIKTNVRLSDFPCTVLVKDNVIKYSFMGTKSKRKIKAILEDIDF